MSTATPTAGPAPHSAHHGTPLPRHWLGLDRAGRAWVLGLLAAAGLGVVNLWLVLTFVRQLFATLDML